MHGNLVADGGGVAKIFGATSPAGAIPDSSYPLFNKNIQLFSEPHYSEFFPF